MQIASNSWSEQTKYKDKEKEKDIDEDNDRETKAPLNVGNANC